MISLQNPKDHAEFTIVRNWVQKALQVTHSWLQSEMQQHNLILLFMEAVVEELKHHKSTIPLLLRASVAERCQG